MKMVIIMKLGYGLYEEDDNHENRIWYVWGGG